MAAIFVKGSGGSPAPAGATLLWTNPNPTSNRDTFSVNEDYTNYDAVIIEARTSTSDGHTNKGVIMKNGTGELCANNGTRRLTGRYVTVFNDTTITFSRGFDAGSGNNQNADCIPLRIWGIVTGI